MKPKSKGKDETSNNSNKDVEVDDEEEVDDETEIEEEDETEIEDDETEEGDDEEDTVESLKAAVARLQAALRKANKQAASRRIQLRELKKGAEESSDTENEPKTDGRTKASKLDVQLAEANKRLRRFEMKDTVGAVLDEMGIVTANTQARNDLLEFAMTTLEAELEDDEEPEEDLVKDSVRKVIKKRPYLVSKKIPGKTDSTKRGKTEDLLIDEKEIATKFGIPYTAEK